VSLSVRRGTLRPSTPLTAAPRPGWRHAPQRHCSWLPALHGPFESQLVVAEKSAAAEKTAAAGVVDEPGSWSEQQGGFGLRAARQSHRGRIQHQWLSPWGVEGRRGREEGRW